MQKRFDMTVEEEIQLAMEFCELQELNLVSKYLDSLLK